MAAASIRGAQGPFWLATNQDPAYFYLYDSLRVARGLPPNLVVVPGTAVQLLGAIVLRARHPEQGERTLESRVLGDPEASLAALHAVLLGASLLALVVLGWVTLGATRNPVLCWLAQSAPFLTSGTLTELARVKPEPLLLALSLVMAALLLQHAGPESAARGDHAVLLGVAMGLALAAKFSAFPLVLVPLVALDGRGARLRFAGVAILSFLAGTLPMLPRLPTAIDFLWRSARGPGAYGTGLFASAYGPAVRVVLVESAPVLCLIAASLAAGLGRRPLSRSDRRLLLALVAAQAVGVVVLLRQPYGGVRLLLPEAGLLGLNLVLVARAFAWDAGGRLRRVPAVLGLVAVTLLGWREARVVSRQQPEFRRVAREQEGAARAADGAGKCAVVDYHKASSVPSALLFGYSRPEVDGGHLQLLQSLYPSALFLDYVQEPGTLEPSSFRFLPYQSWTHPRFRDFRGGLRLEQVLQGRSCVVFHGSSAGPGRVFVSAEFARESIPLPGPVEPIYSSPTESVYRVEAKQELR